MSAPRSLIERIIDASIRHRGFVLGATLAVAAAGVWAFTTLNTDAFPDLTPNQVLVMTEAPGLSPAEVENQVTYPMEVTMLGLPRTTNVRSISKVGLSVVTVTFEDDVDLYFARAQVQQRMQDAVMSLPQGAEPMLGPPATAMGEVFQYLVEAENGARDSLTLLQLSNVQEYVIAPLLRTVPGVASVNAWGGLEQQFEVLADPAKLSGFDLTLHDLETALSNNNANFGGGYIEDRGERLTLRGLGRVGDTTDIASVVVATREATPVYVRDVARVTIGGAPRYGAVTRDGRGEALSAAVIILKGSNGREVVGRVLARLDEIKRVLPRGVVIRPFYNQGEVVARTTRTVFRNLIEGALLVTAILFLFLRTFRASLLTASVIPLSLLVAFLAMRELGVSANLMSLGALDFGLIVDASVVMVENYVRRLHGRLGLTPDARRELIREAAFEVGRPVVFGVAIIVAVYIPIFTLEGIEGRMFRPMAFTVCAAVLGSLVLALTYVPAISVYAFESEGSRGGRSSHEDAAWFVLVRQRYERALAWALTHRRAVVGGALALLAISLGSVPFLGTEFMPKLDEGYMLIETRRVPSASLAQGVAVSEDVERTLRSLPEVAGVVTNLGRPHEATETMALNQADVYVTFKPRGEWRERSLDVLIERMDSALAEVPGLDYEFSAPMRMRLDEVISGVRTDLGIKIYGDSLPVLQEKAAEMERVVGAIPGAEDVSVGASAGAMQLEVDLDRAAIARYGLNVADVREAVESGIGGAEATQVLEGRRRYPIVVRLDAAYRSTPEAVGQTLIRTPAGGTVTLSQVARLRTVEGPEVIEHEGGQRYVVVKSNVRGRDLGSFVADVRRAIGERVAMPAGYFVTYGGQFENQARATRRLAVIVPLVLLLIAALLYASFGSVRHALLVMLNVPFALVGGIAALWLRGLNLNLSASVGFIALFGVAVLNGVVLLSYINQLRAAGHALGDAVREGAEVRLRPVLMTALVASVGFIPMALSTSAGAEVQRPLATVVIGGLVSSTILTLLVMPTVYAWIEERRLSRVSVAAGLGIDHVTPTTEAT
ncbi:MAG TPA: CusA/CzcA family heavy metal efflux RND transporter [Gemmatimonadaceae bacterium]|nr:CusA/CzcA family heavy metal efflux RND transporter [Gemmatimonadaceae bacterium]